MFVSCRDYLVEKLKKSISKGKVYLNQKELDNDAAPFKAAVIIDTDETERSGQKTIYRDEQGEKHKRIKKFVRTLTFILTIGAPTDLEAEKAFENFLSNIDEGIFINDNYTPIKVMGASWYDEKDKIIRAQAAVVFKVQFEGGVYSDTDFLKVKADIDT
ncbi:MAG: hypothetical protein ACI4LO_01965 [Anaerovoracaceae bacterium]